MYKILKGNYNAKDLAQKFNEDEKLSENEESISIDSGIDKGSQESVKGSVKLSDDVDYSNNKSEAIFDRKQSRHYED